MYEYQLSDKDGEYNKNEIAEDKKNFINFITDHMKGKGIDLAIAIAMGFVLSLIKTDIKSLPSIGAVLTFIINQYLLPVSNKS